jgi:hypothetical protein
VEPGQVVPRERVTVAAQASVGGREEPSGGRSQVLGLGLLGPDEEDRPLTRWSPG